MPSIKFSERRILFVEDDALAAMEVKATLDDLGCHVIGPIASVARALRVVSTERLDSAVLDINLGTELSFPIADDLTAVKVPFLFLTAYNRAVLPLPYCNRPVLSKPLIPKLLVVELHACPLSSGGRGLS